MNNTTVSHSRPKVAVFGLGDYYRKLRDHIWSYLDPVSLIDPRSIDELGLDGREARIFTRLAKKGDITELLHGAEVSFILTPHPYHAPYAQALLECGQRVFVEKPFAVSMTEVTTLEDYVKRDASIYFSDFYVDVRSAPLLWFLARLQPGDWRLELLQGISAEPPGKEVLGDIKEIQGCILERYSMHEKPWLARQPYGGVLWDTMVHLLALLKFMFPKEELEIRSRSMRYHKKGRPPAVYEDARPVTDAAEAYATIEGLLLPSKVPVRFRAGKNYNRHLRFFLIRGERGHCEQVFGPQHPLVFCVDANKRRVTMDGDRYDLVVRGFLDWFRAGLNTYGWDWNKWAVEKLIEVKNFGP